MNSFYPLKAALKQLATLICFIFICTSNVHAQSPVLTAANTSLQVGDRFVFHYCTTNNFDTTNAGQNQVWDYSYLTDSVYFGTSIPVVDSQTCILPSATQLSDSFPNATIATTHTIPVGFSPHNDYYSDNTGYFYWGYYVGSNYNIYKTPLLKYRFSLSLMEVPILTQKPILIQAFLTRRLKTCPILTQE